MTLPETLKATVITMRTLDYILYIIHSFLLIFKKVNNQDIEGRSKTTLTMICFLIGLLIASIVYGFFIFNKVIIHNKIVIYVLGICLFLTFRYLIFKSYRLRYYKVVDSLKTKFPHSKKRIILTFSIVWFMSVFLLWFGIILIRKMIYNI